MTLRILIAALSALLLVGCGGAGDQPSATGSAPFSTTTPVAAETTRHKETATPSPTPSEAVAVKGDAVKIAQQVAELTKGKVVQYTEDNDPNNLLGRPTGYMDAANIQWLECVPAEDGQEPIGVDCGATVEIWPTPEGALSRAEYLQAIHKEIKLLGSEYTYVRANVLLRISGEVKPSQAEKLNVIEGKAILPS